MEQTNIYYFPDQLLVTGNRPAKVPDVPSIFSAQPPNERAPVMNNKSALPVSVMI